MDGATATLIAGFVTGTIGFSLFLYGKKQVRPPQLAGGLVLMVLPFAVPGALWLTVLSGVVLAGTCAAVRAGH